MKQTPPAPEGRRSFLRALGGTVALAGFGQAFGQEGSKVIPADTSALNLAATAEALAVTFYHHALNAPQFRMDSETLRQLKAVLAAEQAHLDLLLGLGGKPIRQSFALPAELLADARIFAETGLELENAFTGAYIAASHEFAQQGQPELAATAAQLAASEAQHLTVLSQLAGFGPSALTLPAVPFRHIADAPPKLATYLSRAGKDRVNVALPARSEVLALVDSAVTEASAQAFVHAYPVKRRG